eukprot:1265145-Karenia_brevis.AAC.1
MQSSQSLYMILRAVSTTYYLLGSEVSKCTNYLADLLTPTIRLRIFQPWLFDSFAHMSENAKHFQVDDLRFGRSHNVSKGVGHSRRAL